MKVSPGSNLPCRYSSAILVDRRVIYHHNGETTDIALADVVEVAHRQESLIGDIIEVVDVNGNALLIEIAPLNDGPAFLRALDRARAADNPREDTATDSD